MSLTNTITSVINIVRGLVNDQTQFDGQNAFSFDTDNKFRLSEMFVQSSSIIVYQNGVDITDSNWAYNADTNQVIISFTTSGGSLNKDDIIVITYNYYKKYSDIELTLFIESSLAYFVQHRYIKTFLVNNNSEIVSENNTNPTTDEIYFIAIISSILIDPQNININTQDFKLTSNRSESDQTQIAKAFAQFKRFLGKISFEKFIPNGNKW